MLSPMTAIRLRFDRIETHRFVIESTDLSPDLVSQDTTFICTLFELNAPGVRFLLLFGQVETFGNAQEQFAEPRPFLLLKCHAQHGVPSVNKNGAVQVNPADRSVAD
jgi:hypothetical protein